uniref:Uncharacterized protein n=1 Tax=Parascaris univalens TaxID=6257 RepID=A0A915ADY5_PARUN
MADEWPTTDIITDDTGSQIDCKLLKERREGKFEGEENVEWQHRSVDTSSEDSTFTTNEYGSVLSDADRERSSASSVISEKFEDQTFEGEEVDENDDETTFWNEVLAAEAERALERANIPHPNCFFDDSNRFGPNITILSSTSSHTNEEIAVKAAAKALERFPANKMLAARMIKKQCEERLNGAWHCIVSEGDVGFFSRNDEHIHFTFRRSTVYMFPHHCYEPGEMRIRRLKNPDSSVMEIQIPESVDVIANGMNLERQQYAIRLAINAIAKYGSKCNNAFIAEKIVDGFEEIYGAHFHCAVSDKDIGCHVRYDPDNIIFFNFDGLTICLFKQNPTNEDPFTSLHPLRERKISGVLVPLKQQRRQYVIKSGMDPETLQLAIVFTQTAISESEDRIRIQTCWSISLHSG